MARLDSDSPPRAESSPAPPSPLGLPIASGAKIFWRRRGIVDTSILWEHGSAPDGTKSAATPPLKLAKLAPRRSQAGLIRHSRKSLVPKIPEFLDIRHR